MNCVTYCYESQEKVFGFKFNFQLNAESCFVVNEIVYKPACCRHVWVVKNTCFLALPVAVLVN